MQTNCVKWTAEKNLTFLDTLLNHFVMPQNINANNYIAQFDRFVQCYSALKIIWLKYQNLAGLAVREACILIQLEEDLQHKCSPNSNCLKQELVHWKQYQTRYEAQQDMLRYITTFYNPERLHSYLDYRSPNQYEADMKKLKKVA